MLALDGCTVAGFYERLRWWESVLRMSWRM